MRIRDLANPDWAMRFFTKVIVWVVLLCVSFQFVCCVLRQLSPFTEFLLVCAFLLLSPVAYLIREWRRGGKPPRVARRGAERTPLLPQQEENE